jgi:magnesium transporter
MANRKAHTRPRIRERKPNRAPAGGVPGTVKPPPDASPTVVRMIAYGERDRVEKELDDLSTLKDDLARFPVVWVDVVGLGHADRIREIGKIFELHPLALEDVVHTHQRAKCEEYPAGHYIVLRAPRFDAAPGLDLEQISVFFGQGYVVTFQERDIDTFAPVRARIRSSTGRLLRSGSDYLAYALLDAAVDSFFPELEWYGDRLEKIEDRILADDTTDVVPELHGIKRDLLAVRRTVWPLREAINTLMREEHPNINPETRLYLRDVYDHTVQLVEQMETHREVASGALDIYLSTINNRMNEVMKVLTIIATIFIPLSFVAGVYGMNFDQRASPLNMPELSWYWGYPFALAIMAAIAFGLLIYFRRKRWL